MKKTLTKEDWQVLNNMSRADLEEVLIDYGFACYEYETNDDLRAAIAVNIRDNTITRLVLDCYDYEGVYE